MKVEKFLAEKIKAVLLGGAVGDALGVPVEFQPRGSFHVDDMIGHGTYDQPSGTWSDDTSLTLCLVDAITRLSSNDFNSMLKTTAHNFCLWYWNRNFTANGEVFDVGNSTAKAIKKLLDGTSPLESGCSEMNENGNGSLMRIAPLAFYVADRPQGERFEIVNRISSITHSHPISVLACIIYVEYLLKLLKGEDKFTAFEETQKQIMDALVVGELADYFHNEITDYFMPLIFPGNKWHLAKEGDIKSGGFVADTLKAAIWCFLSTDNYKDAVLKAVNLGEDTDTTAAVTGGLAGAYYGIGGIPQKWIEGLAKHEVISGFADSIYFRSKAN